MDPECDVPERLQREDISGYNADKLELEANYIHNQLAVGSGNFFGMDMEVVRSIRKEDIAKFLRLHYIEKFEVPFIARYRKDECPSLLYSANWSFTRQKEMKMHTALWLVENLSRNWHTLERRKEIFLKKFANVSFMKEVAAKCANLNCDEISLIKEVSEASSNMEMDDVEQKLCFILGGVGITIDGNAHLFENFLKADLWKLAGKFVNNTRDYDSMPDQLANTLICDEFPTLEDVLSGARLMAAFAISCEPHIRKQIRSKYLDILELSTSRKAPDGTVASDIILKGKPLCMFDEAQWLFLHKAEEDNLIDVTFEMPQEQLNVLLRELNDNYRSRAMNQSAVKWNEHRKLIVGVATSNFLLPLMKKEARSLFTSRAKSWLLIEYGKVLWKKVSMAPAYHRKKTDTKEDRKVAAAGPPVVMACCWGAAGSALVMLDMEGQLIEELPIGSYSWESFDHVEDRFNNDDTNIRYLNDVKRVLELVTTRRPRVAVIGAVNMSCILLRKLLLTVIASVACNDKASFSIRIVYGDESLACLYESSQISSDQLPGKSGIIKRAVALGRYIQNPLAMVATLCGPRKEIVHWDILNSPIANCLTPDEKYRMIERVMVDVTNQFGFNINRARYGYWYSSTLQFIAGLGPREASRLQQELLNSKFEIGYRIDLRDYGLGEKVYANAVGFLGVWSRFSKIYVDKVGVWSRFSNKFVDQLDGTRIHPESYSLAEELVKEACGYSGVCIFWSDIRKMLKSFDIEIYAKSKGLEHMMQTLVDIKNEVIKGFRDQRRKYQKPREDEQFYWITKKSDDDLCEGRIVKARVESFSSTSARCYTIDIDLMGTLRIEDYSYSDGRRTTNLKEKLKKGEIISCTIKSVKKSDFEVCLRSLN